MGDGEQVDQGDEIFQYWQWGVYCYYWQCGGDGQYYVYYDVWCQVKYLV